MTNMFKKSLVAIALTGIASSAMAAELNSDQVGVSSEWLSVASSTQPVTVANFAYQIEASYTANDIVEFTFTGDSVDASSMKSTVISEDGEYTLSRLSTRLNDNGDRVVVYRVTAATNNAPDDSEFKFGDIDFAARSIDGNVSVSTRAETNTGQPLDDGATQTLIYVGTQYAALRGNLSAVIDVASSRTQFTKLGNATPPNPVLTGSDVSSDFVTLSALPRVGNPEQDIDPVFFGTGFAVTSSAVEYTLKGDFSFLLDEEGEYDDSGDVTVAIACDDEFEVSASSISFVCSSTVHGPNSVAFEVAPRSEVVLPAQTINVEAAVLYGFNGSQGVANFSQSAGSWTLNGSNVQVSYMPYSGSITQVINVTNRSAQTGDVSVIAIDEAGERFDLGVIAQSDARTITTLAGPIRQALSEATGIDLTSNSTTRRYALEITTNAPQGSVEVYSAYNVGQTGARLVVNSSNGGAVSKSN